MRRGAAERVGDVARDVNFDCVEFRPATGGIDTRQPAEVASAGFQLGSAIVEQTKTECFAEPGAAVVGGAAADADDQASGARVDCGEDQLAGAARGGDEGIAPGGRDQDEPGGGGHLEHRGLAVSQHAERRPDRFTSRAGDFGFVRGAAGGGDQGVDGSFAAVGHGDRVDRCARAGPCDSASHCGGRGGG